MPDSKHNWNSVHWLDCIWGNWENCRHCVFRWSSSASSSSASIYPRGSAKLAFHPDGVSFRKVGLMMHQRELVWWLSRQHFSKIITTPPFARVTPPSILAIIPMVRTQLTIVHPCHHLTHFHWHRPHHGSVSWRRVGQGSRWCAAHLTPF